MQSFIDKIIFQNKNFRGVITQPNTLKHILKIWEYITKLQHNSNPLIFYQCTPSQVNVSETIFQARDSDQENNLALELHSHNVHISARNIVCLSWKFSETTKSCVVLIGISLVIRQIDHFSCTYRYIYRHSLVYVCELPKTHSKQLSSQKSIPNYIFITSVETVPLTASFNQHSLSTYQTDSYTSTLVI